MPWDFLSERSVFSSNKMTLGKCLSSGWGLVTRKTKLWLEAWNFSAAFTCPLHPPEGGEWVEIEVVLDHACVMNPP